MKRREIVIGASIITFSLSGCLGDLNGEDDNIDGENNDIEYEQCGLTYIFLTDLPSPAKKEANAAITNEVYETDDRLVLSEVIDINGSYLVDWKENRGWVYYDATVMTDDDITRLYIEETRPKKTGIPTVKNEMEIDATVNIRIESEGVLILEDTFDITAGTAIDLTNDTEYPYGDYLAIFTISTEEGTRKEKITWLRNHIQGYGDIVITTDSVRITDGPSAEPSVCEWNHEGELGSP